MPDQKLCVDLPELVILSIAFSFSPIHITSEIRWQFVWANCKNACYTKIYLQEKSSCRGGRVHITVGSFAR